MSFSSTLRMISPRLKMTPLPLPAAMPRSASRASPGPLTTQPSTLILIAVVLPASATSSSAMIFSRSIASRPHVGQAISSGLRTRRRVACRMSNAAGISGTGSPSRLMRIVSPMPSSRIGAKPHADLAPILLDGIGDTIRISLLGDPVPEIPAAFDILQATRRRVRKPELIACPTCGRLAIDLEKIIAELEQRLAGRTTPCKISVLGCVVNGPGEAREADIGIAAGNGKGVIFRNGEIVRNVLEAEMVDALVEEIDR